MIRFVAEFVGFAFADMTVQLIRRSNWRKKVGNTKRVWTKAHPSEFLEVGACVCACVRGLLETASQIGKKHKGGNSGKI